MRAKEDDLRRYSLDGASIRRALDGENLAVDIVTLGLSYAFILVAAWNDGILGLAPSTWTNMIEMALAVGLAGEIVVRAVFTSQRNAVFWLLIAIDTVSILTVVPSLPYVTFARIARLTVSAARMLQLIDRLSRRRGNPFYILLIYPMIVPVAAALFYAFEKSAKSPEVHNYFQSLVLMMSYSLTVGLASQHPVTYAGKIIAGLMLLIGIMCVSIIGNALSSRYTFVRTDDGATQGSSSDIV